MIGCGGKRMLRLTARYADLWNAPAFAPRMVPPGNNRPEAFEPVIGLLDAACKEVGRDPCTLGRTACVMWRPSDEVEVNMPWFGEPLTGGPEEISEVFQEFARTGVSHLQVGVFPHSLAGVEAFCPILEALDQTN